MVDHLAGLSSFLFHDGATADTITYSANKEYMMKKWLAISAMTISALGCESTRPVTRYPGLNAPHDTATCVIREANHCFIGSIDDHPIEQYDVNILSPGTYRQYRIPAGPHNLVVFYREDRNFEIISGGPRHVAINVDNNRDYVI